MNILKYILFVIIFLGIANWGVFYYFFLHLFKPKQKLISINDKELINTAKKKTGLNIIIKIMDIDKMIGFMISSPPFPAVMVFSKKLFNAFNKNEKEWVVLHESAHYFMWHSLKFALSQLTLLIIGLIIINELNNNLLIMWNLVLGVILGIIYVQIAKIFEYQADNFAAKNMDDPKGMITGNKKMSKSYTGLWQNKIFKNFFSIAVPYEERIRIAEKQLRFKKK